MAARRVLLLALCAQLVLAASQPRPQASPARLSLPPRAEQLRLASLGDPIGLAQALTVYLQSTDREPGTSVPLGDLDYERVEVWLERLLELDAASSYPLLLATHVYAQAPDPAQQRRMLQFAYRSYAADTRTRWRWLAHACLMARHRLHDLPLALRYARTLAATPPEAGIPAWAAHMEILVREEMGEHEAARVLLGGLLASGRVKDAREMHFLIGELDRLAASAEATSPLPRN